MKILVTGAAGYIGSVVTQFLVEQGYEVIALDNLRHGYQAAVHPQARFVQGDLLDAGWLIQFVTANPVDAVVHLAAEALVDASMRDPGRFYQVNVCGGLNLLEAMAQTGVESIVFSSTAALYGEPTVVPIDEDAALAPVNTYGDSKLTFERMMAWYRRAYGLRYVALRYFNACGATDDYGEAHVPETHLVPLLCAAAMGQRGPLHLHGTDYGTPDGTCIRDYVHVTDIARAHLLALENLDRVQARVFNIGNGIGYSNWEVIETVRQVTGKRVDVVASPRRPGDPARLIASPDRIRCELGWEPACPTLSAMVETAWTWHRAHPHGYQA